MVSRLARFVLDSFGKQLFLIFVEEDCAEEDESRGVELCESRIHRMILHVQIVALGWNKDDKDAVASELD